jgi:hypothetical protein
VNDLDFIAYIANQGCWWPFRYILNHAKQHTMMQSMQGKCLRTKPKHKTQFPLNPQNFSLIGIHCQNGHFFKGNQTIWRTKIANKIR